jgi:hypothetical protein
MVAKNIKMIIWGSNQNNTRSKREWKIIIKIINKISEIELTITEADKVNNFTHNNQFTIFNNNPTQYYQKNYKTNTKTT